MKKTLQNDIEFKFEGFIHDYLQNITNQWLLIAPKSNPGMLEMFKDRNVSPLRNMEAWAGEFAGKYLTSAVQIYKLTRNEQLKAFLNQFVEKLTNLQDSDGYLGVWPDSVKLANYKNSEYKEDSWDTWSHYHIMLGLILWHEETGDKNSLNCVRRIADLICEKYLGDKTPRLVDTPSTDMNLAPVHSLAILHRLTNEKKYLDMAIQIVDEFAAEKEDGSLLAGDYLRQALSGKEFYQTPKPRWESLHPVMAFSELYQITGKKHYLQALKNIWNSIVKFDRHNNGGFSSGEKATGNPYDFGAIESCCTIAWIALSVEMIKLTLNSKVADEIELSTLNSVVGMFSSTGRWSSYNTPMNGEFCASTQHVTFQAREGTPELNCCSVNAPRGFGMISDWAIIKNNNSFIINYYGPSTISVKSSPENNIIFTQKTSYPLDNKVKLSVKTDFVVSFNLKLRIPEWSKNTAVTINGEEIKNVNPGTYLDIDREWKTGDDINIEFDFSLRFWIGEKDCKGLTSIYRGPILLAYDHRYNLHNAPNGEFVREYDVWDKRNCMLTPPAIDGKNIKLKPLEWDDWIKPLLLFEVDGVNGEKINLCDFASCGETGTPYLSWIPVT